jgi:hypothetical protein
MLLVDFSGFRERDPERLEAQGGEALLRPKHAQWNQIE